MENNINLLPTAEDIKFYNQHGYYISNKIFTDEEIEAALQGMEAIYAGKLDRPSKGPFNKYNPNWEFGEGLRKTDYASFYSSGLRALTRKPILGQIASLLSGSAEIRLWHDQLLYKPSQKNSPPANVGWHTDRMYWKTCTSEDMLTAWIPFHNADEEIGTITMIDGSNNWPDNTGELNFFSSDMHSLESKFNTGGSQVKKVPMLLKKGQVSFHNCMTIHGSGPNLTDQPRKSIAVHLQDEKNQYQEHFQDGEKADHLNCQFCREVDGQPDFSDPEVCPVLYREI